MHWGVSNPLQAVNELLTNTIVCKVSQKQDLFWVGISRDVYTTYFIGIGKVGLKHTRLNIYPQSYNIFITTFLLQHFHPAPYRSE
jgi:hypothetical protein